MLVQLALLVADSSSPSRACCGGMTIQLLFWLRELSGKPPREVKQCALAVEVSLYLTPYTPGRSLYSLKSSRFSEVYAMYCTLSARKQCIKIIFTVLCWPDPKCTGSAG